MKILIADNELMILSTLSDFLRRCGHVVYTAQDAEETMKTLSDNSKNIDALIADVRLCQHAGVDLMQTLKNDYPDISSILLSGYGNDLSISQAIELGAVSVQRKPISLKELELVVNQLEEKRKTSGLLQTISEDLKNEKERDSNNIRDRQFLRKMHTRLIPRNFDWLKHTFAHIRYLPMSGVGGDYIDLRYFGEGNVLIFMADVSGSGLQAAFSASAFKIWFSALEEGTGTAEILQSADNIVREVLPEEYLVTAFCGIYNENDKKLTYSIAGHLEPILIRSNNSCACLYANGPALGLEMQKEFEVCEQQLNEGDYLLAYTDGLTEQPEKLSREIQKNIPQWKILKHDNNIESLMTYVFDIASQMNPARAFADDIAVLLISPKSAAINQSGTSLSDKRILVVDDNNSVLCLISELLQQSGCMTKCIDDSTKTLQTVNDFKPDMVIMDICIPKQDGVETMTILHKKHPSLPVLLMTGQNPQEQVTVAVQKKAAGLLAKPFTIKDFKESVIAALNYKANQDDIQIDTIANDWLDCIISSSPQCLQMLTNYLLILNKQPVPADILNDLIYCIREIAGNAIEWGNHHNPGLKVRISTVLLEDRALVRIQDEGGGFNARKMLEENSDIEEAQKERQRQGKRDGGFGLPIVRSMVDQINYNQKGNSAVLTKFFRSSHSRSMEKHVTGS